MSTTKRTDPELRSNLQALYGDTCDCKLVFVDDHDNAISGVSDNTGVDTKPVVIYLLDTLVENLLADSGMDKELALRSYLRITALTDYGGQRPVFMHTLGAYEKELLETVVAEEP